MGDGVSMEKIRNLSLKKTMVLYTILSLIVTFFLSVSIIEIAGQIQEEVWWKYHISSKQYTEEGIRLRLLGENMPSESGCIACDVTLEDAYIYVTNR